MAIKITRTLYVGLGGTGVKAILRAKQCFVDAYGDVPPMVAFLAIDTDKDIRNMSVKSRIGRDVKLSENEICFCGIKGSALEIYNYNPSAYQWVPKRNVSFLANLKNDGAGQVRSNGRFLARYNANAIATRVASKVTEIGSPLPIGSDFIYDTDKDGMEYPTKVNIVGSVAGGTGSGTFIDVLILIAKTLRENGRSYSIRPWLVLPDVFRHIAPGPATSGVYQNAYGAIRELDYLYHLSKDNTSPIDFKFDQVRYLDEGIRNAYIVNSTNTSGVTFQNVDDITDAIGRCMFLPSNEGESVEDNLDTYSFDYDVKNKKAHYISAGSAEIVYDNQAVGNVIAKAIISQICNELIRPTSMDALKEVNAWMASENVAIQEHDADLLTDGILSLHAPFSVIVEKDSDINTINANIFVGADADNVIAEARNNESEKLKVVRSELVTKINEILGTQNGVGAAKAFLESLLDNVAICKEEMNTESAKLQNSLSYPIDWATELESLKGGVFRPFDRTGAEALQTKISDYIAQKRDLLRHRWAIQFYTDFEVFVNGLLSKINVFKANLEIVERKQRREISVIQQAARTNSHFQIFLHIDELENFSLPEVSQSFALFRSLNPIHELVDKSDMVLDEIFYNFAKEQNAVITAKSVSIEQKMEKMTDAQRREIFRKVKEMSSPMWSTNPGGFQDEPKEHVAVFIIGVYDRAKGIIKEKYEDLFINGSQKPTFSTTHQTDRITFFKGVWASPAYAINNMSAYARENDEKFQREAFPVSYLDERWHQRMLVEGFDILPTPEKDRVLPNWVNAIVYGFIKYDEENKSYYIESEQGDVLLGGVLELGQRRDLAFEQFQMRGLDKEVEARIQQMVLEKGRPAVTEIIKVVKNNLRNYMSQYAQLSAVELDRVQAKDRAYQMVRDLLEKEVLHLRELNF